jgi:predicted nucleotidyltransferase component of viral defense system
MADSPTNMAASIKDRLLTLARAEGRSFDIFLVRFALERLLFRLSQSQYRDRYVLKGGMLVTGWLDHGNRETRDIDFLGFGESDGDAIKAIFAKIMTIECDDGLRFDTDALTTTTIREDIEYGGIRLRTTAYLEQTRIPITLDIAFGDALYDGPQDIAHPSLLGMEQPIIASYPPEAVIAEKFHAVVALGLANGRMKDFYDLWAVPKSIAISSQALEKAIGATFDRREMLVPTQRPIGLSSTMASDPATARRWKAYMASLDLPPPDFQTVLDEIWEMLSPACATLVTRA